GGHSLPPLCFPAPDRAGAGRHGGGGLAWCCDRQHVVAVGHATVTRTGSDGVINTGTVVACRGGRNVSALAVEQTVVAEAEQRVIAALAAGGRLKEADLQRAGQ